MNTELNNNTDWKGETRAELIKVIDNFLDVSSSGGWAVKYKHPLLEKHEDGTTIFNSTVFSGVDLYIQFTFNNLLSVNSIRAAIPEGSSGLGS